jgi:uncharacterized protein (TIGR02145 family)/prepilin-type N-terminal cleavage/methylation domain-containing protein
MTKHTVSKFLKKKFKGFTLVEILVSVAIIGILVSLSIIATTRVRLKTRDAKRISNATTIVSALEAYFDSNKSYPTMIFPGQPIASNGITYLKAVPSNPLPRIDGGCAGTDYTYTTTTTGYKLTFCIGSDNGDFPKGIVICKNGNCGVKDDCENSVTDRDGFIYRTIKIGDQCWMAENLKTQTKPDGSSVNTGVGWGCSAPPCIWPTSNFWFSERYCMDLNNNADCDIGQGVYTWYSAMNVDPNGAVPVEGSQGLCPDDWHIPTHNEFTTLERAVCTSASCATDFPYDSTTIGVRGTNEGGVLHNDLGFNFGYIGGVDAYSGGNCPIGWPLSYCTGALRYHFGSGGDIWTSTTSGPGGSIPYPAAWLRNINTVDNPKIKRLNDFQKFDKLSVRCLKDS